MADWNEMGGLEKIVRVVSAATAIAAAYRCLRERDMFGTVGCAALAFLALGADGDEINAIVSTLKA